jgi:putative DNA primase/helicase
LARLHGSRFVSIAEPDKSARLNAGLVKQISGAGDPLNARFLHQNSFTFIPSFKLFIHCNGLPRVSDDTLFSSGRVRVIPFDRSFSPEEQDKSLSTFFERSENLSSILNWCIEGARLYFQNGLHESLVVHAATSKYRLDNDPVQLYLNECFDVEGDGQTSLRILRDSYSVWCGENGFKPFARTGFIKELEVHGISIKGIHNHQTGVAGRLYQQGVPYSARTLAN